MIDLYGIRNSDIDYSFTFFTPTTSTTQVTIANNQMLMTIYQDNDRYVINITFNYTGSSMSKNINSGRYYITTNATTSTTYLCDNNGNNVLALTDSGLDSLSTSVVLNSNNFNLVGIN